MKRRTGSISNVVGWLTVVLCSCGLPEHGSSVSDSRAPLDERVDAFLDKHEIDPLDCGMVEYVDGCSTESVEAIECFSDAQASCTEARVDVVNRFVEPGDPFYATFIVWSADTGCLTEMLTYSVEEARDGDEPFRDLTCTDATWRPYKDYCKKLMYEDDGCHARR